MPQTADAQVVARPLYSQVREKILGRIKKFEWSPGEALPNEGQLSAQLGVSIGTIRRAIEDLQERGIVKRIQGRGTFVVGVGPFVLREKFNRIARRGGEIADVRYELLSIRRRGAGSQEAANLRLQVGHEVVVVRQMLSIDGQAVGFEESVLDAKRFPKLESQMSFGQHLYLVLSEFGSLVARVEERLSFGRADAESRELLGVTSDAHLIEVRRVAYDISNDPIESRRTTFLSNSIEYICAIN